MSSERVVISRVTNPASSKKNHRQDGVQFKPEFLRILPNNKIPAIADHAPEEDGKPILVFESGAILLYLAEKTGKLLSRDLLKRMQTLQGCSGRWPALAQCSGNSLFFAVRKNPTHLLLSVIPTSQTGFSVY